MSKQAKELGIEEQIFICKNSKNMSISEMSQKIGFPQYQIKETLEILKANGIYDQYVKMTDEDIARKKDITIPLHYNSMAARLLEKQNFNKNYVGFEYWKKLIALMMYKPEYLNKSLKSEIYPIIARKCYTSEANVESQLRFSLNTAMGKQKYTIVSFLSTMLNSNINDKDNYEAEKGGKTIKTMEENNKKELEINTFQDETIVKVPAKIIMEYWYMKGYIDAVEGNTLKFSNAKEVTNHETINCENNT